MCLAPDQWVRFFFPRCCRGYERRSKLRNGWLGSSLVVQWLRIHCPKQGMWVQSLVWELRSHMPQGIASQRVTARESPRPATMIQSSQRKKKEKGMGSWLFLKFCRGGKLRLFTDSALCILSILGACSVTNFRLSRGSESLLL